MVDNNRIDRSYRIRHGRLTQTRNGRGYSHMPAITLIDDPRWRQQDEKKGTVRLDQAAYSLAENDLPGIVPLHLNENLFQAAQDATSQSDIADLMQAALNQLHSYPKSGAKQLQKAVAAHLSIASHKLVIGHGSSAVLRDLFLYLLRKGDTLLMPAQAGAITKLWRIW
jgi:aspartate/methionine/tyrosine aminotransferase